MIAQVGQDAGETGRPVPSPRSLASWRRVNDRAIRQCQELQSAKYFLPGLVGTKGRLDDYHAVFLSQNSVRACSRETGVCDQDQDSLQGDGETERVYGVVSACLEDPMTNDLGKVASIRMLEDRNCV